MKAGYEKPLIVFEEYTLDVAIAACTTKVSLGPGDLNNNACSDYPDVIAVEETGGTNFYETTTGSSSCTCYLTSGDGTLLTS